MNRRTIFSVVLSLAAVGHLWAGEGEALFKAKCAVCHSPQMPKDMSKMIAPPAQGITMHVKMAHPQKEAFVAFVSDYALNPSAEKALCEGRTVRRFGIMPSQQGNVTEEELRKIAGYLYDHYALGGHLKEKHERMRRRFMQGPGHGQGMNPGGDTPQQGKIQMH